MLRIPRACAVTLLAFAVLSSPAAIAAVIDVNVVTDELDEAGCLGAPSDCSLREAIVDANALPGPDTIRLTDPGSAFAYYLQLEGADEDEARSGDLDILDDLTIEPLAATGLETIDERTGERAFDVKPGVRLTLRRIYVIGAGAEIGPTIRNVGGELVMEGGSVRSGSFTAGPVSLGGCIHSTGAVTLRDVDVYQCAEADEPFAAIWSEGDLVMEGGSLYRNDLSGGLVVDQGVAELTNVTFWSNELDRSGTYAIQNRGTTRLQNVTFATDQDPEVVVLNESGAVLEMRNTLVVGSCAGAGSFVSLGGNLERPGDSCGFDDATDQVDVTKDQLHMVDGRGSPSARGRNAVRLGSFAIDAGVPDGCPATDLDGRPRSDGLCDTGSYEAIAPRSTERMKIRPSAPEHRYGRYPAVAIDGDTIAVSGATEGEQPAVFLIEREHGLWAETEMLVRDPPVSAPYDFGFGSALAVSGKVVAVGDAASGQKGRVQIYTRGAEGWGEPTVLEASDATTGDRFGVSMALEGERLVVVRIAPQPAPVPTYDSVYVYEREGDAWVEQDRIKVGGARTVALEGDVAVIGATNFGLAVVLTHDGAGSWAIDDVLLPWDPDPPLGFGAAVALDGGSLVVGTRENLPLHRESAYLLEWTGEVFEPLAVGTGEFPKQELYGRSVAISEGTILVGAEHDEENGYRSGGVYSYSDGPLGWEDGPRLLAENGYDDEELGSAVAASRATGVTLSPFTRVWAEPPEGAVYTFDLCTDKDHDGYGIEERCGEIDCQDSDPDVKPGAREIPGNGIDDDCDPSTPDSGALFADDFETGAMDRWSSWAPATTAAPRRP